MKRFITTFVMMTLLAIVLPFATATTAQAQSRCYNSRTGRYYLCKNPNFYQRHRKLVNIAGTAAAGALLGGLLGGRKGVAIGALAGAGGGWLITKKQRPKNYIRSYNY